MASVLAVGAHPDDVEAGCFGTLLRHKSCGDRVFVVVTTRGGDSARNWETIEGEFKKAQSLLGQSYTILDNPNGHYSMTWKTVGELDAIVRQHEIDTVYSVWHGDSHQDHQMTFKNVLAACRSKRVSNLYCYELPDYSYRSNISFAARRFVDVTAFLDTKIEAVSAFETYFTPRQLEAIEGLARHRGGACGVKYAEAFEVIFEMWK